VEIGIEFNVDEMPVAEIDISSLRAADSPRLDGEDVRHIKALADLLIPLPPIIVHAQTRQVIDGMHRLMAARIRGQETITARLFSGSLSSAFVLAVRTNIAHGLPLSTADRKAAAARVIASHPQWSDRMIASITGLAARTIKAVRECPGDDAPQLDGRIGLDGRMRPIDAAARRALAARLVIEHPEYSLRRIARQAGLSPETVRSVRQQLADGELRHHSESDLAVPLWDRGRARTGAEEPHVSPTASTDAGESIAATHDLDLRRSLQALLDDPALRSKEVGRSLLRILQTYRLLERYSAEYAESVPEHDLPLVTRIAQANVDAWRRLAEMVKRRQHAEAGRADPVARPSQSQIGI